MRRNPRELRRALADLAARTGGLFTASQALTTGYSYPAQHFHVKQGDWVRVDRGIFRLADQPLTGRPDLIRWTLWSGGQGVISHDSALAVHDLGDVMPSRTHLTLPPRARRSTDGLVIHHARLEASEIEDRGGYRVTTPMRSIVDAAADHLEVDHLAGVIRDAVDQRLLTPHSLRTAATRTPASIAPIDLALRQIAS